MLLSLKLNFIKLSIIHTVKQKVKFVVLQHSSNLQCFLTSAKTLNYFEHYVYLPGVVTITSIGKGFNRHFLVNLDMDNY